MTGSFSFDAGASDRSAFRSKTMLPARQVDGDCAGAARVDAAHLERMREPRGSGRTPAVASGASASASAAATMETLRTP